MSKQSSERKAYGQVLRSGGSKEEAKQASKQAGNESARRSVEQFFGGSFKSREQNESDFDSDINGNGTNWHTSEDL